MRKMMNKKGFTLVELMIVVVILGILVAIAVPIFSSVTKNAKKKACASNIRIIEGNCSTYLATGNNGEPFGKGSTPSTSDASFLALFKGNALPKCMSKGGDGTAYAVSFDTTTDASTYSVACTDTDCPNYVAP